MEVYNCLTFYCESCDPMKEGNNGIWFEEEDHDSEFYKPECCSNVYEDLAKGKFENLDEEYEAEDEEYDAEDENDEFEEIDLNAC